MKTAFRNNLSTDIKLPPQIEMAIFLIGAELRNEKFTDSLGQIGFDTTICSLGLSKMILSLVGFEELSDDLLNWYYQLMESYLEIIDLEDRQKIYEHAFDFYLDLVVRHRSVGEIQND